MDDTDLSTDKHLPSVLLDLANYKYDDLVQRSLLLLDRYYTSQTDIFQKAFQTQLLKTAESSKLYNTVEGLLLKLATFLRSGSTEAILGPSPVKELTQYCWLEDEVEGFEPHQINQNIILSFGESTKGFNTFLSMGLAVARPLVIAILLGLRTG